jgi:hypothetical protein
MAIILASFWAGIVLLNQDPNPTAEMQLCDLLIMVAVAFMAGESLGGGSAYGMMRELEAE